MKDEGAGEGSEMEEQLFHRNKLTPRSPDELRNKEETVVSGY